MIVAFIIEPWRTRSSMSQGVPFRQQALQFYTQQDQVTAMPRFVSLRFALLLWGVLVLCVGAAFASWLIQIPSYVPVSGIVQAQSGSGIVLFLSSREAAGVQRGTPVQVQLGTHGPVFSATVATVEPGVMNPDVARQRYRLGSSAWGVVNEPSIALIVPLAAGYTEQAYAGSLVSAQVQVGSSPVFALLLGLNASPGGK
jgi:hypothetical protein